MFNRIRRAAASARQHFRPGAGRHRRLSEPHRPTEAMWRPSIRHLLQIQPPREDMAILYGDDTELVRPYVLTSNELAWQRRQKSRGYLFVGPSFNAAEAL